jgi:hypothetical protein
MLNPTISLANIGIDENVFNESANPKRDFTMTLSPKTDWWLPFAGTWFNGVVSEDLVWYDRYSSERSANTTLGVGWKAPLAISMFDVGARRAWTQDRPSLEIDERAARTQKSYSATVSVRVLTDTSVDLTAKMDQTRFDEDEVFNGVNLSNELNRNVTTFGLGVTQKLTPFTTLTLGASRQQDRFQIDPLRDMDSIHGTATVKFDPLALIAGTFAVAYSDYSPRSTTVPAYSGMTFAGELSYVPRDTTRLKFGAQRGLEYSYDSTEPYYVQTAFNLEFAQQIFGPFDFVARGGRARLDYRSQTDVVLPVPNQMDNVNSFGGGIGYRIGRSLRVGFNADMIRRVSTDPAREYARPTYGASVTYEF